MLYELSRKRIDEVTDFIDRALDPAPLRLRYQKRIKNCLESLENVTGNRECNANTVNCS